VDGEGKERKRRRRWWEKGAGYIYPPAHHLYP